MLLFGAKRLPEAARGLGRSTRILRSEIGSIGSDRPPRQTSISRSRELQGI
jgi:sec-independent protein translocase protein TatA